MKFSSRIDKLSPPLDPDQARPSPTFSRKKLLHCFPKSCGNFDFFELGIPFDFTQDMLCGFARGRIPTPCQAGRSDSCQKPWKA